MGSLMLEENVVSAAGTVHHLTLDQMRSAISELGWEPRRRNVFYEIVDGTHDQLLETRSQSPANVELPLLTSAT
jgi:cyclic dehypoxanthinyl futalosine synthase